MVGNVNRDKNGTMISVIVSVKNTAQWETIISGILVHELASGMMFVIWVNI